MEFLPARGPVGSVPVFQRFLVAPFGHFGVVTADQ
jgi:hypothetical protein